MAHFARLESGIVVEVIVINNDTITDRDGNEIEAIGQSFCTDLFGGTWIQTSYNANFRGRFAAGGMTYDPEIDEFVEYKCPELAALDKNDLS